VREPQRLTDVPTGGRATLGPPTLEPTRSRRLAELGLRAGADVVVIARTSGGGRVVALAEDRIALDRDTVDRLVLAAPSPTAETG
jgi:ferrous iron transport protein A